jgi:hypothetical protein
VQALKQDPMSLEAAINEKAPERAYLAVMNGATHLSVLQCLHRWKAPNGGCSCFDGCIVAFEGEARDAHGLPLLWKFDKQEELLIQCCQLPASALRHATLFYRDSDKDDRFHTCQISPPPGWHGEIVETCRRLIPIPVGWAHMFLDCLSMGTAFWQTIQLMLSTKAAERHHLRPFCEGVARACGSPDPNATNPHSTLNSKWKRVAYTKAMLTLATAAWDGHHLAPRKPPPPSLKPWPPSQFNLIFGGTVRKEDDNQKWGNNLEDRPNTLHYDADRQVVTPRGAQCTQEPNIGLHKRRPPRRASNEGAPMVASQRPASRAAGTGSCQPGDDIGPVPSDMGGITDLLV